MFNQMRPWKGVIAVLVAVTVLIVIGCGGGGGGGGSTGLTGTTSTSGATGSTSTSGSTGTVGSGTLVYTLQWPAETRAIPSFAPSVVVTVYTAGTTHVVATKTVNRNQVFAYNQNVTFNLP